MLTYKKTIGHVAIWFAVLGFGFWYYSRAGSELWESTAETYFSPGWLMNPLFLGMFFFLARASDSSRKWHSVLRVLVWTFGPWLLLSQVRPLIRIGIENFYSNPSPRAFQVISAGGALLLQGLLAWILSAPLTPPLRDEEGRLYTRCRAVAFVLGLGLAFLIVERMTFSLRDNGLLPDSQTALFHHQFQQLGILLLFLFFLRVELAPMVVELTRLVRTDGAGESDGHDLRIDA